MQRRSRPRARIPRLQVAVARNSWLLRKVAVPCSLVDISDSGVCIESSELRGAIGQRVNLTFDYEGSVFPCRGFVRRIAHKSDTRQFGIAFIYAPHQLQRMIEVFLKQSPAATVDNVFRIDQVRMRGKEKRIPFNDAEVYVKAEGGEGTVVCQVDNISKGGMGFLSPVRFWRDAPFGVTVQISEDPEALYVTGKVRYMGQSGARFYYGMEYDVVPERYLSLLNRWAE